MLLRRFLRVTNENAREKHKHAADDDLHRGREPGRVHVTVPDEADGGQLHHHNGNGGAEGSSERASTSAASARYAPPPRRVLPIRLGAPLRVLALRPQ